MYAHDFCVSATKTVSQADILSLCAALTQRFGKGHTFSGDAACGGFISVAEYPGRDTGDYKYMRIWPLLCPMSFPMDASVPKLDSDPNADDEGIMKTWSASDDVAIKRGKYKISFRTAGGAPEWTEWDAEVVEECLWDMCGLVKIDKISFRTTVDASTVDARTVDSTAAAARGNYCRSGTLRRHAKTKPNGRRGSIVRKQAAEGGEL
jgi:hypothetical protein